MRTDPFANFLQLYQSNQTIHYIFYSFSRRFPTLPCDLQTCQPKNMEMSVTFVMAWASERSDRAGGL